MAIGKKVGFLILSSATLLAEEISYSVDFEGIEDPKALKALRSASQLIAFRKKTPSSINALRFRAESDVPDLVRVLRARGYLEADVEMLLHAATREYKVTVSIRPGPLYKIQQYEVFCKNSQMNKVPSIRAEDVGMNLGDPADTKNIIESELLALQILSERGYPLAVVENREIVADGKTNRVKVLLTIDTGPLSHFGSTTIEGNVSVASTLIEQQIQLSEKETYNSSQVEATQKALMETGLFSSVYLTHPKKLDDNELLPMKVEVTETKHKSVSVGASFQTTFGPGASFGWENRNIGGMGRKMTLAADIAQKSHSGIASFLIPNFREMGQSYIIQAQAWHESIKPYKMQSYSFLNRLDREVDQHLFLSIGPKLDYMMVTSSVDNGNFLLAEAPVFVRWTDVEDFLNPGKGYRLEYRGVPTVNIKNASDFYYSQTLTFCNYFPLWEGSLIAQKLTLGNIFSNGLGAVPVPKRFLGGSEDNLRGYKYYTVSPLDDKNEPIGGRSAVYYSIEPRFRFAKSFGVVPFFDIGNVYSSSFPTFGGKWRKSTGVGLRYYSFLGPLRLDVAFPLDRREIDPRFWIFASLGQTF